MGDKGKRIFQRLVTGLQIGKNQSAFLRFMTLTSAKDQPRPIKKSFDILRKRIERATFYNDGFDGFKFNRYFCIRTFEGNGVLHVIFWGKYANRIPQAWLSWNWEQIHWAYKADIRACWTRRRKVNGLTNYLLGNYLMNQPIERMSYGWKWAWLGFCKSWNKVKGVYGWLRAGRMEYPYSGYIPEKFRGHARHIEAWNSVLWNPPPTTRKLRLEKFCEA